MSEITAYETELIARRRRIAAETAAWPDQYETVREAIAKGFIPDAYGNVNDDTSILCPPTKFGYPRAGVSAPMHAGGIGAGADVTVYASPRGTPDELRHERVWLISIQPVCISLLWDVMCARRSVARTFDGALAFAVELGDYAHKHYIVPQYQPERRQPSLLLKHWRELAEVPLPTPNGPAQLDLFAPKTETALERAQRQLRDALATIRQTEYVAAAQPDDRIELSLHAYDVMALAAVANQRRYDAMTEARDEVPA